MDSPYYLHTIKLSRPLKTLRGMHVYCIEHLYDRLGEVINGFKMNVTSRYIIVESDDYKLHGISLQNIAV